MPTKERSTPSIKPETNILDPMCVAIAEKHGVLDFLRVFDAFLNCQKEGYGLFFSRNSKGLKSEYADDSQWLTRFGDFTKLLRLLYVAEKALLLTQADKMTEEDRQGLLEIGISPEAYQSFAGILLERGVQKIPQEGIENLNPALIEIFHGFSMGFRIATKLRGTPCPGAFQPAIESSDMSWLKLSRDSAEDDQQPLFGLAIRLSHPTKAEDSWSKDSRRIVLGARVEVEDALNVAESEEKAAFYCPNSDSFVTRTSFYLGGLIIGEREVVCPEDSRAQKAFAKALLDGKVEVDPMTSIELESEEAEKLRRQWEKFGKFKRLLSRSRFISVGSAWGREQLLCKLDGRTSIKEIQNWFNLYPSQFSPKQVAIFIEKRGDLMDREYPDWKSETVLFDGKAVSEELAKLRTYAADHPERINVTDDGNIWVLDSDGSFVSPEQKFLRGRDGVHKFWPIIWSNEIVLRFTGSDYIVTAGEDAEVTEKVVEAVRSLEFRQDFPKNAFGLDESFGQEARELIPLVETLVGDCPATGKSLKDVFSQKASKIASALLSRHGFTISNEAGSILRLTDRQCTRSEGWKKSLGEVGNYDAHLLAFQKNGKMYLTIKLSEK